MTSYRLAVWVTTADDVLHQEIFWKEKIDVSASRINLCNKKFCPKNVMFALWNILKNINWMRTCKSVMVSETIEIHSKRSLVQTHERTQWCESISMWYTLFILEFA